MEANVTIEHSRTVNIEFIGKEVEELRNYRRFTPVLQKDVLTVHLYHGCLSFSQKNISQSRVIAPSYISGSGDDTCLELEFSQSQFFVNYVGNAKYTRLSVIPTGNTLQGFVKSFAIVLPRLDVQPGVTNITLPTIIGPTYVVSPTTSGADVQQLANGKIDNFEFAH